MKQFIINTTIDALSNLMSGIVVIGFFVYFIS
jgi:hypothetical protein